MPKLEVYLRSIEKFGATGAVLASGQAVILRFPSGDRHATQVTPHDQLVQIVREIAPAGVVEQIEQGRTAALELESGGRRYAVSVAPLGGGWQLTIEAAGPAAADPPPVPAAAPARDGSTSSSLLIGSVLDHLTRAARGASASDIYLGAGAVAVHRVAGELVSAGTGVIDGDVIARELGVVAPPEARAAWTDTGTAMFTYGDGSGRVRVTLARDHRGPCAALRILPAEPPSLAELELGGAAAAVEGWLGGQGLIVVAGPSGSGKTVTLAALVRALGERRRRVVTIEEPIELVHASAWISQRAVGEHVASVSTAVGCAMNEGADAIVIGRVSSEATARGAVEAVSGGHLVLVTVVAPVGGVALDRMIAHLPADQRELAHGLLFSALLGTIQPVVARTGERTFEITSPRA